MDTYLLKTISARQAYGRAYRFKNKAKRAAYQKEWKAKNAQHVEEYSKSYRTDYYQKNKDSVKERVARYYKSRREDPAWREKFNLQSREWRKNNREKSDMIAKNNKSRRRMVTRAGTVSRAEWDAVKSEFLNRCAYCDKAGRMTMDHDIPLSRGGKHHISNIIPACKSCNSRKHTKTSWEFAPEKFKEKST